MARTLLVRLIALACMTKGLWDLGDFLLPFFSLPTPIMIKVFPLIVGIWEVGAGFYLLKLREAGRKLTVALAFMSMGIIILFMFWTLLFWEAGYTSDLYFRETLIFQTENRFISAGMQFAFVAILLWVILFLSQAKTKMLFTGEPTSKNDSKPLVKSAES